MILSFVLRKAIPSATVLRSERFRAERKTRSSLSTPKSNCMDEKGVSYTMSLGSNGAESVERQTSALNQPSAQQIEGTLFLQDPTQIALLSTPTTQPFRLRDLPEELQRQCVRYCLPSKWCFRVSGPIRRITSHPSFSQVCQLHYDPLIPSSLYLVDKRMSSQVHSALVRNFQGEIHFDDCFMYEAFRPFRQKWRTGLEPLEPFRHLITILHVDMTYCRSFQGFDLRPAGILANLRTLVAHVESRLYEGSLYGWGDAHHLISVISNESLVGFVRPVHDWLKQGGSRTPMEQLWQVGVNILFEMKIIMGYGEMEIAFYGVFWLRQNEDIVLLGKHPVKEWLESSKLRRSVYDRAV